MSRFRITVFLLLLSTTALAQSKKQQLELVNAGELGRNGFYEEVPFKDRGGYFIIPVSIGDQTYEYIFDTGGYNTVTSEIMSKNDLRSIMKVTVGSSNKVQSQITLSKVPQLNIGGISFTNVGVFNFDFIEAPIIRCYTNGGLIGKSLIRQLVWQIDYQQRIIRLSDKLDNMPHLENGVKLKVQLDKLFNPFITAKVNGKNQRFHLDFGYGGFISLTTETAANSNLNHTIESFGEGAVGANGAIEEPMYASALESFTIGEKSFNNPIAFYSKSNNYNLIGSELARYFIVTLNFPAKELILSPRNDTPIDQFNPFGIDMNVDKGTIYVSRIYKGFSGDTEGIKLKDKVVHVNEITVDTVDLCESYFKIREALYKSDSINLRVKRHDTEIDFVLIRKN